MITNLLYVVGLNLVYQISKNLIKNLSVAISALKNSSFTKSMKHHVFF